MSLELVSKFKLRRLIKMKKYKKFCFLGIGLLPLVLTSCGTNTAAKDSQDVTEKKK